MTTKWNTLRENVIRMLPHAQILLSSGVHPTTMGDPEPDTIVLDQLESDAAYQRVQKNITAVLDRQVELKDDDVDLSVIEIRAATVGFELGVAYGLQLNPTTFLHSSDTKRRQRRKGGSR